MPCVIFTEVGESSSQSILGHFHLLKKKPLTFGCRPPLPPAWAVIAVLLVSAEGPPECHMPGSCPTAASVLHLRECFSRLIGLRSFLLWNRIPWCGQTTFPCTGGGALDCLCFADVNTVLCVWEGGSVSLQDSSALPDMLHFCVLAAGSRMVYIQFSIVAF